MSNAFFHLIHYAQLYIVWRTDSQEWHTLFQWFGLICCRTDFWYFLENIVPRHNLLRLLPTIWQFLKTDKWISAPPLLFIPLPLLDGARGIMSLVIHLCMHRSNMLFPRYLWYHWLVFTKLLSVVYFGMNCSVLVQRSKSRSRHDP